MNASKTGSTVTTVKRAGLFVLTAASLVAGSLTAASAQQTFRQGAGSVILVTPDGDILDYMPDASEVRTMRDRRGRTVLVDHYGNIVATVMPGDGYGAGRQGRDLDIYTNRQRGEIYSNRQRGYGYSEPDVTTGSVPDYRDYRPNDVSREELPGTEQAFPDSQNGFPDDQTASIGPDPSSPPGPQMPPAITVTKKSKPEITALQVFLDREGFSPGVIDGRMGSNVTKAIEAWQQATGETLDPNNTEDILERLRLNGGLPITSYTITATDAAGPYVASIPDDYAHKAALPHLSFTSTSEMLGEKFHMDEAYLRELNPGVDFTIPGTIIKVINPGETKKGKVAKILASTLR